VSSIIQRKTKKWGSRECLRDRRFRARGTVNYFFLTCMRGWLVGCHINIQGFPLGKVFVPQTVVWYKFLVNCFFWGKTKARKKRQEKEGLRCVGLYFPPRARGGVRIFSWQQTNKQKIHRIPTICFQHQTVFSNKVSHWLRKKSDVCFNLCVCICVCRYLFVHVDKRACMCAVRVHTWIKTYIGLSDLVYIHINVYINIFMIIYICIYIYTFVHIYKYI